MSVCDAALIGRQANAGVTDRPCSMAHTRYLSPPPSLVATATALALAALTHRHIALAKPVFLRLLRDELGVRTAVRLEEDVLEHKKNSLPLPLPKKTSWCIAKCAPLPGSDMRLLRLTYGIWQVHMPTGLARTGSGTKTDTSRTGGRGTPVTTTRRGTRTVERAPKEMKPYARADISRHARDRRGNGQTAPTTLSRCVPMRLADMINSLSPTHSRTQSMNVSTRVDR